jgi:polysaccharide export outer membrane protein
MIKKLNYFLGVVLLLFSASSCRILYPNEMFKQKDYQFFELAKKKIEEYVIEPGDQLTLQVYSRDGFKLVDVLGGGFGGSSSGGGGGAASSGAASGGASGGGGGGGGQTYLVDKEGFAKLPVLGMLYVKGYTQNELENQLAQRYASLFVSPFVILKVSNRRVFVFKGEGASVVNLNNAPTSLIEVLALNGGLSRQLKAYNIKIIRGDLSNPQVRILNLSTLEGLRTADLTVQSGDIIYVEQKRTVVNDALILLTPLFTAFTTGVSVVVLALTIPKL